MIEQTFAVMFGGIGSQMRLNALIGIRTSFQPMTTSALSSVGPRQLVAHPSITTSRTIDFTSSTREHAVCLKDLLKGFVS